MKPLYLSRFHFFNKKIPSFHSHPAKSLINHNHNTFHHNQITIRAIKLSSPFHFLQLSTLCRKMWTRLTFYRSNDNAPWVYLAPCQFPMEYGDNFPLNFIMMMTLKNDTFFTVLSSWSLLKVHQTKRAIN